MIDDDDDDDDDDDVQHHLGTRYDQQHSSLMSHDEDLINQGFL